MSGGSYSGALAAWTESTAPGTFWAYHASSAPVEAIYDYVSALNTPQCGGDVSNMAILEVAILLPRSAGYAPELQPRCEPGHRPH